MLEGVDDSLKKFYLNKFGFGTNYDPSTSLLGNASSYTTVDSSTTDTSWLTALLKLANTGVSAYANSQLNGSTVSSSAADVLAAYNAKVAADAAAAKQKQQQTYIIGGLVLLALAVGIYFISKKK